MPAYPVDRVGPGVTTGDEWWDFRPCPPGGAVVTVEVSDVTTIRGGTMRALVYHGPGTKAWEEAPKPTLQADTDAIVRVDAVTICGTASAGGWS